MGAVPSLCGVFGRFEEGGSGTLGWQSLFLSAIFSTVLSALVLGGFGTLLYGALVSNRFTRRWGAPVAAVGGTLLGALYLLARGTGEAFRLTNEAPLNLGTIEFLYEGVRHLLLPLLVEYAGLAAAIGVVTTSACWGLFRYLSRNDLGRVFAAPLLMRGVGTLGVLLGLLFVLTTPRMAEAGGLRRTSDLALLASIAARQAETALVNEQVAQGETPVSPGPKRSSGELWSSSVHYMEGARPNVILIMLESVGLSHLGFEGYERPTTPNLDKIARNGVRFRNARTTATHSNYAQMAVISSLFPRRFSGLDTYRKLNYPRVLWHDFLSELNYQTATYSSQDETWQGMIRFQQTDTSTEFHHAATYDGEKVVMGSESIVPDEVTAKRAIAWMSKQDGPFGLYLNFQSTHFPYRLPKAARRSYLPDRPTRGKFHYLKYPKSDRPAVLNRYDNALSYVDEQIGRIYSFLEATDQLESTLLVITSDHGELFWDHGMVTHGRSLFDAEARVPLIVHAPGRVAPADDTSAVSTLDVLPTLAGLLEVPSHPAFQGQDLLSTERNVRRPIFMNIQGMKSHDAVVCEGLKLVKKRGSGELLFFDLNRDPDEKTNLITERRGQAETLHHLLTAQMRAQISYHSRDNQAVRDSRFAPRLASCPVGLKAKELTSLGTTHP